MTLWKRLMNLILLLASGLCSLELSTVASLHHGFKFVTYCITGNGGNGEVPGEGLCTGGHLEWPVLPYSFHVLCRRSTSLPIPPEV